MHDVAVTTFLLSKRYAKEMPHELLTKTRLDVANLHERGINERLLIGNGHRASPF